MEYNDEKAAEFYENPENRSSVGPPRRRKNSSQRLTNHVPVRFTAEVIEQVKEFAEQDHQTVSSWIRQLVEREVSRRRLPRVGVTALAVLPSSSFHEPQMTEGPTAPERGLPALAL
jgi:hypothetical protein